MLVVVLMMMQQNQQEHERCDPQNTAGNSIKQRQAGVSCQGRDGTENSQEPTNPDNDPQPRRDMSGFGHISDENGPQNSVDPRVRNTDGGCDHRELSYGIC